MHTTNNGNNQVSAEPMKEKRERAEKKQSSESLMATVNEKAKKASDCLAYSAIDRSEGN